MSVIQTLDGCKLVSQSSVTIATVCSQTFSRAKSEEEAAEVVVFMNDVFINLTSKGVHTGEKFIGTALYQTVHCSVYQAARKYLESLITSGYFKHGNTRIQECLRSMTASINREYPLMVMNRHERRIAAYSLLTGADTNGQHSHFSFDRAVPMDQSSRRVPYINLLGELGAVRTLWHEFRRLQTAHQDDHSVKTVVEGFLRTLRNIHSGHLSLPGEALKDSTGNYEQDCQFDLVTIMQSSWNATTPNRKVPVFDLDIDRDSPFNGKYQGNRKWAYAQIDPGLRDDIIRAFNVPQIDLSMNALQGILSKWLKQN